MVNPQPPPAAAVNLSTLLGRGAFHPGRICLSECLSGAIFLSRKQTSTQLRTPQSASSKLAFSTGLQLSAVPIGGDLELLVGYF